MYSNNVLLAIVFLLLLTSCRQADDVVPSIERRDVGIFAAVEFREEGQGDFTNFRIEVGNDKGELGNILWHGDVSAGALGTTYVMGAYGTELINTRPLFGLQFWSDTLPDNRPWTASELEDFFAPGTSFSFGAGFGKVDVLLKMYSGETYDHRASRPSYLEDPEGALTIVSIVDYDYESYLNNAKDGHSFGKLVRCTFSGEIGRYDILADQADGNPDIFLTDEVIELRNGEVLFYVEYHRD